jgi:hypothetical protein
MDACFPLMAMASVTSRQPQRPHVDFAAVQPSQWKIHDRLENWARWCRGSQRQTGTAGSPMFNLYRSSEAKRQYGEETCPTSTAARSTGATCTPGARPARPGSWG